MPTGLKGRNRNVSFQGIKIDEQPIEPTLYSRVGTFVFWSGRRRVKPSQCDLSCGSNCKYGDRVLPTSFFLFKSGRVEEWGTDEQNEICCSRDQHIFPRLRDFELEFLY